MVCFLNNMISFTLKHAYVTHFNFLIKIYCVLQILFLKNIFRFFYNMTQKNMYILVLYNFIEKCVHIEKIYLHFSINIIHNQSFNTIYNQIY